MPVDVTMEKAQGKMHQNPEHSLLASLSNPQVTLLSVQKRCTFRTSPGLGSLARSESSEEKCPPQPEEELSPGVLARTLERRSQVSAVEHRLGALGTETFAARGSSSSPRGRGVEERDCECRRPTVFW